MWVAALGGVAALGVAAPANADAAESPTISLRAVPQPSALGYETDPGIAPDADGQGELFSLSGLQGNYGELVEGSPGGTLTPVGPSYDAQFLDSAVDADGFDWLLTTEGLMAISASGAVTNFQIALPAANDMALGPDGDLYITNTGENTILKCTITSAPAATCATTISIPSSFVSPAPQSITSAGGQLWFTTSLGELGSVSTTGTVGGPYDEVASTFSGGPAGPSANLLAAAPSGSLWTTAIASNDARNAQLVELNGSTGAIVARYGTQAGLPRNANIAGLTVGPDGNVWFIDSGGAGFIGVLDVNDGRVTEFPFPSGYEASAVTPSGIAVGPGDTLWFSAVTADDGPAIGEIRGLAPASLSVGPTASATGYRSAALRVSCSGSSDAGCSGNLALSTVATMRQRTRVHGHLATVTVHKTVTLGTVSYHVAAGRSAIVRATLRSEARTLLTAAFDHTLSGWATATPEIGLPTRFALSIKA